MQAPQVASRPLLLPLWRSELRLLLVSGDSFLVAQREQIVALAAQHAVPTLYHRREFTAVGGLMSYGPPLSEAYYVVGDFTGRILNWCSTLRLRRRLRLPCRRHCSRPPTR